MKKLAQGAIGTGTGTLAYTVPSSYRAEVTNIDVCNTTGGAITLTLHLVPVGVAVGTTNAFTYGYSVAANSVFSWEGRQALNAGDFIQVIGGGEGLTMNITGEEIR